MEEKIRELEISDKEFKALNKCTPDVRYRYTLKRIAWRDRSMLGQHGRHKTVPKSAF